MTEIKRGPVITTEPFIFREKYKSFNETNNIKGGIHYDKLNGQIHY